MDLNEKYTFFVVMFGTSNHLFFFVIVHRFSCFRTQKKNNKFSEKKWPQTLDRFLFFYYICTIKKRLLVYLFALVY